MLLLKTKMVKAALNQLVDGNSDLVMETIKESITYYSGLQQLSFGVLLIVAFIVKFVSQIVIVFMWLKRISILNYKNLEQAELAFSRKMNCITGNNVGEDQVNALRELGLKA